MPTPYYDSNDGYPAYLLRNDGEGVFQDITESSGLSEKRNRRTYSASLADLDGDLDLDLVVANGDSNNVSIFINDGQGAFAEDVLYATGTSPHDVTLGDVDGDCVVGDTDQAIDSLA